MLLLFILLLILVPTILAVMFPFVAYVFTRIAVFMLSMLASAFTFGGMILIVWLIMVATRH